MTKHNTASITAGQKVEGAFVRILQTNLNTVKEWEPIAFAGMDIEGVHQMRVCLRRMRSALTVFRSAIPRKAAGKLGKEMRWAAKALDRARDLDVYISENLSANKQKKMRDVAVKRRNEAYEQVRDFIQGERYLGLCGEFSRWLKAKAWRDKLSEDEWKILEERITPFASRVLAQHRDQVLRDGGEIHRLDSEALHQLRIDCKKLRYATEFFSPLYGKQMKTFTGHLKALQDLLGTLHDTTVIAGLQKDLLKGKNNRKLKNLARGLAARRWKEAKAIRKTLKVRWNTFSRVEPPWGETRAEVA